MHCRDKIKQWALPVIKNHRTYVDVGADVGSTSEPFLDLFEEIVAFEPNPTQYEQLSKNSRIKSYGVALGNESGSITLKIPEQTMNPGHGSTALRRNKNWQGPSYEVPLRRLDEYDLKNVDFIKIDVEQGELEVVQGAENIILRDRPVVMFENKREENKLLVKMFKNWGYKVKIFAGDAVAYT